MFTATITSQGQVTIPAQTRRDMGLNPGDKLSFVPGSADRREYRVVKSIPFEKLAGILAPYAKGKPKLTPKRLEELRVKMYTERYKRYLAQNA